MDLSTGAVTFLVSDALGSVRGVVSPSGGLEATATYEAWGNVEGSSSLNSYTPIGFDGVSTDETGLTYFVHRYYDPGAGQFAIVDPAATVTGQPYSFTNSDPTNGVDPLGLRVSLGGSATCGIHGVSIVCNGVTMADTKEQGSYNLVTGVGKGTMKVTKQTATPFSASTSTSQAVQEYVAASTISQLSPGNKHKINGVCAASLVVTGGGAFVGGWETMSAGRAALQGLGEAGTDISSGLVGIFLVAAGTVTMYGSGVAVLNAFTGLCRE